MQRNTITKYRPFPPIDLPDRRWPNRTIDHAPIWCSVDLRDGNQALATPMSIEEKIEFFETLVRVGFKEIEVGFPSASQIEFDFIRRLIDENRIPDDVAVQVLVQAKAELIERTIESVRGAKKAIVHLYNSTNPQQRRLVFNLEKKGVVELAVKGTELIKRLAQSIPETDVMFEYSPESFCLTELDFSLEICEAVASVWQPTPRRRMIMNLPATVESATPNIHADQIEWFCRNLKNRDAVVVSLHTHNDRGTGVAATELALMAGADRVEGTLFGNGERTGNLDIVTVALNMYTQGVDPQLDLSQINAIRDVYERCTKLEVPIRHPYAGELVFTAFSGSHQDAINKGLKQQSRADGSVWEVPYLPIDPRDIGRNYRAIIRINSQSGKGGVAYVMEHEFGFQLPKAMHKEIGKLINHIADQRGHELTPADIHRVFMEEYIDRRSPLELMSFVCSPKASGGVEGRGLLIREGKEIEISGTGNGPIDAFAHALHGVGLGPFEILSYAEHSLGRGAEAKAVAYIEIKRGERSVFGAAIDTNIEMASLKAVVSALQRDGVSK